MWVLKMLILSVCATTVHGLDAVVCDKYPSYTHTVDCGPDAIIDVQHTTAAYFYNTEACNWQEVIDETPQKAVKIRFLASVLGCHGSRRCEIRSDAGVRRERGLRLNTLHMKYDCLKLNSPTSGVLPIYQDITNQELNIFSPNFPNPIPSSAFSFSCNITSGGNRNPNVELSFVVEKLIFLPGKQCGEDFFVLEDGRAAISLCSNQLEHVTKWQYHTTVTAPELSFTYRKLNDKPGGLFWLRIIGYSDQLSSFVPLTLTCPDQDQIPGYTPPSTLTSTPTPPTTTSTPTATPTNEPISANIPPSADTAKSISSDGDESDGSNSTWHGVIGGCLFVILIAGIVIALLVLKLRKRGNGDQGKPDRSGVGAVNPTGPSPENLDGAGGGGSRGGDEYAEINEGEAGFPRLYTTPVVVKYENSLPSDNINADKKYENVDEKKGDDEYEDVSAKIDVSEKANVTYESLQERVKVQEDLNSKIYTSLA